MSEANGNFRGRAADAGVRAYTKKKATNNHLLVTFFAEEAGFEPAILFRSIPVFETSAFSHSAILPVRGYKGR